MKEKLEEMGVKLPELLMPSKSVAPEKWAVVACDQYTSAPKYWQEVEETVGPSPSTLRLILPEIFLGTDKESSKTEIINKTMREYLNDGTLESMPDGTVLVERTVNGHTRTGLMLSLDLEKYDFSAGSNSLIRATEGTVVERIPPRLRIRERAKIELPHIIVLIDDPGRTVIEPIAQMELETVYDFDLMQGGGHLTGKFVPSQKLEGLEPALEHLLDTAQSVMGAGKEILFAVGDGNHSLATAKTAWENIKKTLSPDEIETHPARYALCEIENIHDDGIIFEPIHRVLFGDNTQNGNILLDKTLEILKKQNGEAYIEDAIKPSTGFAIPYYTGESQGKIIIPNPSHTLAVGVLQNALDVLVKEMQICSIDYIHGEQDLRELSENPSNLGFYLPAINKSSLFPSVSRDGALPRKTFSMGEAYEKRYYYESRLISKDN